MNTTFTTFLEINAIFEMQGQFENLQALKNSTAKERIAKIKKIITYLTHEKNQNKWLEALWKDLRKSKEEALTTELTPIISAAYYIYDELNSWMRDQAVGRPLALAGLKSYIKFEPKGKVLVIAPWNYPLQLSINPLIHAIAAGNSVVLKPSEIAPATSAFLKEMLDGLFEPNELAVVQGGVPETTALLDLPFNHIFFTGSPAVGKIVMRAAANHLTSVTLELGGKSPVVIDETANIDQTAQKLVFGKCVNAGQTCIAPDYVFIHESKLIDFVTAFQKHLNAFYNSNNGGIQYSNNYPRIINLRNFDRLVSILEDAILKGAKILLKGELDANDQYISPFLLTDLSDDMLVMKEEIFGPILPIITFNDISDVISKINDTEKPLAIYIMSKSTENTNRILNNTSAGGTAINEVMVTSINPQLPFGGSNFSGIGKSNGKYSFIEFSNERGVVIRSWGTLRMIYPPYNLRIISWLTRLAKL